MAAVAGLAELAYAIVNVSTLPVYVKFGLGLPKIVGFAITAFLLSEAVLNGVMGVMADRLGRRRLMVVGPLISVFTCAATAFLRVPEGGSSTGIVAALLALRFIDGAGAAMLWPAIFASIGDRVPKERQASAMSVLNVTYMMGLAFGPLVGGLLNDFFGRQMALPTTDPRRYMPSFAAAGVCFLICSAIALVVAPRRVARPTATTPHTPEPADAGHAPVSLADIGAALRRSPMLLVVVLVVFLGIGLISPNVKLFAMEKFHISEGFFGKLLLVPALVVAVLSVPVGRLGDLWGRARAIHVGMAVCAVSLWMIIIWENVWAMVVLGSLLGIGFVLTFPAYMALLSDIGGKGARGSLIGAVRTAQGVGMLIGAGFASPLYERSTLLPFIIAGVLVTLGFLLSLVSVREPKAATEH
jgi:MFS family permease